MSSSFASVSPAVNIVSEAHPPRMALEAFYLQRFAALEASFASAMTGLLSCDARLDALAEKREVDKTAFAVALHMWQENMHGLQIAVDNDVIQLEDSISQLQPRLTAVEDGAITLGEEVHDLSEDLIEMNQKLHLLDDKIDDKFDTLRSDDLYHLHKAVHYDVLPDVASLRSQVASLTEENRQLRDEAAAFKRQVDEQNEALAARLSALEKKNNEDDRAARRQRTDTSSSSSMEQRFAEILEEMTIVKRQASFSGGSNIMMTQELMKLRQELMKFRTEMADMKSTNQNGMNIVDYNAQRSIK